MALFSRVRSAVLEAERKTADQLTRAARGNAVEAGWPVNAAGNLRAYVGGGKVAVCFDGSEDWELGTESQPPMSVARRIENRSEAEVSRLFDATLADCLRGIL